MSDEMETDVAHVHVARSARRATVADISSPIQTLEPVTKPDKKTRISKADREFLAEVKRLGRPPSKGALTNLQKKMKSSGT